MKLSLGRNYHSRDGEIHQKKRMVMNMWMIRLDEKVMIDITIFSHKLVIYTHSHAYIYKIYKISMKTIQMITSISYLVHMRGIYDWFMAYRTYELF